MSQIKAILFDYGMVLSAAPDPAAWQRMRTVTGLSEDILHREYWAYRHAYDRGDLKSHDFWNKVGSGLCSVYVNGDVGSVRAAVDAGVVRDGVLPLHLAEVRSTPRLRRP